MVERAREVGVGLVQGGRARGGVGSGQAGGRSSGGGIAQSRGSGGGLLGCSWDRSGEARGRGGGGAVRRRLGGGKDGLYSQLGSSPSLMQGAGVLCFAELSSVESKRDRPRACPHPA